MPRESSSLQTVDKLRENQWTNSLSPFKKNARSRQIRHEIGMAMSRIDIWRSCKKTLCEVSWHHAPPNNTFFLGEVSSG